MKSLQTWIRILFSMLLTFLRVWPRPIVEDVFFCTVKSMIGGNEIGTDSGMSPYSSASSFCKTLHVFITSPHFE